jgi:hypothetical protein
LQTIDENPPLRAVDHSSRIDQRDAAAQGFRLFLHAAADRRANIVSTDSETFFRRLVDGAVE